VFVGAPILFKTTASSGSATWLDKRIEFRPAGDGAFSALAGVGLDRAPGNYALVFNGHIIEVAVKAHFYPSSTITVSPKFVQPPKEVQARIEEEMAIKRAVFKSSPPERLWQGPFTAPANTRYTSSFGVRRIYNGRTQSTHQGLDYSAAMGTEIKAANSGRAAIVRDMYFEGGLIVIDHGESIFTPLGVPGERGGSDTDESTHRKKWIERPRHRSSPALRPAMAGFLPGTLNPAAPLDLTSCYSDDRRQRGTRSSTKASVPTSRLPVIRRSGLRGLE
jgi:hypothetical protein